MQPYSLKYTHTAFSSVYFQYQHMCKVQLTDNAVTSKYTNTVKTFSYDV